MEKPMRKMTLPQTDSIEELAAYWDAHDITDHEEELEEIADAFEKKTVVQVPLDTEQAESAGKIAKAQGITLPALIQQWVGEHIRQL
jgi:hypothetical protein